MGGLLVPRLRTTFPRASRPSLWHLCRLPASYRWRSRTHRSSSGPPRLLLPRVREDHAMSTTRDAFHRQVIASSGSTPSFGDLATLPPRSTSRRFFARRALSTGFTLWPVTRRARPPATQSPLLLVRGAERLRFSEPKRRPPTSATHLRRAGTPCVRFILAREVRRRPRASRFALPCREVTQTTGSETREASPRPHRRVRFRDAG